MTTPRVPHRPREYAHLDEEFEAKTIEELIAHNGADGTHSILDMERIADVPEDGAVTAIGAAELSQLFGTERPTREQIEEQMDDLDRLDAFALASWTGVYTIVYRAGVPDELFFFGISGD